MKKLIIAFTAVVLLSGCVTGKDVELPKEGTGTDEMKKSPCVCDPIQFNSGGFEWVG
ncbi:membrane lipoprotein lipid attachment site-containing protein [Thalassospira sp.]|uniref:membrane lipoprotein lipid attachment site-containing protein n=1 Tax=Thalassospira sp. TaxID=1912094 RepID=UPI002734F662|nr:membrane lipoprotein lipid attachment site-containing protein [Thalassospira sp.]MDP2699932.1 membrane lipoprotein lipid attachment site-containing protein [Thalassospira sp.]